MNGKGEKLFVQVSVKDWEKLIAEHEQLKSSAEFRNNLRGAFRESEKIRRGAKPAVTLTEFLNEL
ncbi:MAG: hypothetical protein LH472_10925 [Pyrinomonadaceae bacterium]|nr:hypothetical protein [Pyrinomonadaceae bacterium]